MSEGEGGWIRVRSIRVRSIRVIIRVKVRVDG